MSYSINIEQMEAKPGDTSPSGWRVWVVEHPSGRTIYESRACVELRTMTALASSAIMRSRGCC